MDTPTGHRRKVSRAARITHEQTMAQDLERSLRARLPARCHGVCAPGRSEAGCRSPSSGHVMGHKRPGTAWGISPGGQPLSRLSASDPAVLSHLARQGLEQLVPPGRADNSMSCNSTSPFHRSASAWRAANTSVARLTARAEGERHPKRAKRQAVESLGTNRMAQDNCCLLCLGVNSPGLFLFLELALLDRLSGCLSPSTVDLVILAGLIYDNPRVSIEAPSPSLPPSAADSG